MEYFDIEHLNDYIGTIGEPYNTDSIGAKWYFSERRKLEYLFEELNKKLSESIRINYTEKPNKQAGQGKGFVLKEYILIGFIPKKYTFITDNLFIKLSLGNIKDGRIYFIIEIDINAKKEGNQFAKDREKLREETNWSILFDNTFPKGWEELLERISPIVEKILLYLDSYLNERTDDLIKESKVTKEIKDFRQLPPLNQILFGPPGTGKTYNTINKAIAIANPNFNLTQDRNLVKEEFNRLIAGGQIVFTTFHQSMSYEDFIEGIKPIEPKVEGQAVNYKVIDGIFKEIAKNASSINKLATNPEKENLHFEIEFLNKINYYKTSLGNTNSSEDNEIYDYCVENNVIAIGWGDDIDFSEANSEQKLIEIFKANKFKTSDYAVTALKCLKFWMKKNDIVFISNGNTRVRAIGQITGEYYFDNNAGIRYCQFRPVKWLATDLDIPVEMIYEKKFSQQAIYQMEKLQIKKDFFTNRVQENQSDTPKNNVLIIDEINRGNVSQIFGELITLIEDDKRIGKNEALEVTLPYSKEKFGVPANLYIIGTMNTADRSVEALDAALRRRFCFEEMPPRAELIATKGKLKETHGVLEGIDLVELLRIINKRIEKLIDKDHQIGHSYFMSVLSLEDLKVVFQNKIIPLLQEYFFGDYGKIGLVLGKGFVRKQNWDKKEISFADFDYESSSDFEERDVYEIIDYTKKDLDFTLEIKKITVKMDFLKAIKLTLNQEIE